MAYAAYKEIDKGIKALFMEKVSHFNMVDIGNIRQELIYFERLADEELSFVSSKKNQRFHFFILNWNMFWFGV